MCFFLSVVLTAGVLLSAVFEGIDLDTDVLYVFSLVMYGLPAMMVLVCAAVPYADSICEDMEHKYVMQQIIRGDMKSYISARIFSIFLSALFATAFGIFLFACLLHIKLAWVDVTDLQHYEHMLVSGGLRLFLKNKSFALYFFCYGLRYGVLSGILSLWASYLSMYISSRMLVLAAPVILYYFLDYMLAEISGSRINMALVFHLPTSFCRMICCLHCW